MAKKTAAELAKGPRPKAAPEPDVAPLVRCCKICGAETANPTSLCLTHQRNLVSIKEEQEYARAVIQRNAFRYAELHVQGAEIAAARGDTRPAEWGLLHGRAVEPVKGQDNNGPSVIVQIGVVLPGMGGELPQITTNLPTAALEAEVVHVEEAPSVPPSA